MGHPRRLPSIVARDQTAAVGDEMNEPPVEHRPMDPCVFALATFRSNVVQEDAAENAAVVSYRATMLFENGTR